MSGSLAQVMVLCGAVGKLPKQAPEAPVLDAQALAKKAAPAPVGRGKRGPRRLWPDGFALAALAVLRSGPKSAWDVNEACGVKLANPTASLNEMEGRGLVTRKPAGDGVANGRLKWVYEITPVGQDRLMAAKNGV